MANFFAQYPASAAGSANLSVGINGVTAPTSSTEIGTIDGAGKLQGVSSTNPLPTSQIGISADNIAQVNGITVATGIGASNTGTMRVAVASDSTITSIGSITNALPAGTNAIGSITNTSFAATQATASSLNATVVGTGTFATQVTSLPATPAGTAIIGKVGIDQTTPGTTNGVQVVAALPAGANAIGSITNTSFIATQATAGNLNATVVGTVAVTQSVAANLNATVVGTVTAAQATAANLNATVVGTGTFATQVTSLPVIPSGTNTIGAVTSAGTAKSNVPVYNVYSSTNVTTAAYVQLVASTTSTTNKIQIFDSSGQAMILATGGAGSEVIQAYVPPGGNVYTLTVPAGTRIAYKALTANATSGYLIINFLG